VQGGEKASSEKALERHSTIEELTVLSHFSFIHAKLCTEVQASIYDLGSLRLCKDKAAEANPPVLQAAKLAFSSLGASNHGHLSTLSFRKQSP